MFSKSSALSFLVACSSLQPGSCLSATRQSTGSTLSAELIARDECTPKCAKNFYVDSYKMPDCSWNCVSYTNKIIQVSGPVIAGVATIAAAFVGYAATRRANTHTQTTSGRRDEGTDAFNSLALELFGSLDHPNITYLDPVNGTLMGALGHNRIEIFDNGLDIAGHINLLEVPALLPRTDKLTGAKVIYENARVSGTIEARKFSSAERQEVGNKVANNFESVCNHYGRAMCDCIRSGLGNGWTAAMRVEGQANNNGKYQAISCPSSCNVNERDL